MQCKLIIEQNDFFLVDDSPHCRWSSLLYILHIVVVIWTNLLIYRSCIEQGFKCEGCGNIISNDYLVQDGKKYHPNCISFHTVIISIHYINFMMQILCQCKKCHNLIKGMETKALGSYYHSECFLCEGREEFFC
jgi:hypothetical protein